MNGLGVLLRELRGKRSLRDAAKLSGLSYSYISSLEKGQHPKTKAPILASPDSLKQLAKAYKYDYKEFYRLCGIIDNEDSSTEYPDEHAMLKKAYDNVIDSATKEDLELLELFVDKFKRNK